MNVQEFLRNYRKIEVQISIAEATQRTNGCIAKLKEEKIVIDIAIAKLSQEQQMAIDCHYRQGLPYEVIARKNGYAKSTIAYRASEGIKILQKTLG